MSTSSSPTTHWLASPSSPLPDDAGTSANALCLGTGRFLRSVLVPTLVGAGLRPALIQTRGRSFLEFMSASATNNTYPVDTVLPSGDIQTDDIFCWGAFSLGRAEDKEFLVKEFLPKLEGISILGIGVTEAGLASEETEGMKELYALFQCFWKLMVQDKKWTSRRKICVIDMDNVPNNGDTIRGFMHALASEDAEMTSFLSEHVVFLNTMVDRITSHREGDAMIPKCEPMPVKALVLLDPEENLPPSVAHQPGVVVRKTPGELQMDIALKLRVANGTHTAIAHLLALLRLPKTDVLSSSQPGTLMMQYLDSLVEHQIVPSSSNQDEARAVYDDWRQRLLHPFFGLSSFFIAQNGPAKGGIRWGPTVTDLVRQNIPLQWNLAFAYAVLLRWLTPAPNTTGTSGICTGWLDGVDPRSLSIDTNTAVEYADGLLHNLEQGWYNYKCSLEHDGTTLTKALGDCLTSNSPDDCCEAIRKYLVAPEGGNLASVQDEIDELVKVIASLYARMLSDEGLEAILQALSDGTDGITFTTPCSTRRI
jgi:mannitol-1-phosphate/altronate dehydrogenase